MRARLMTLLLASVPTVALAQAPTAESAATLQKQLRTWFSTMFGPTLTLPEPPLDIVKDGDKYRLSLPLDALTGRKQDEITASLRPLENTRWAIDDIRLPSQGSFSLPMPKDMKADALTATTFTIGEQSIRMVIDTALASRSTGSMELRDIVMKMSGAAQVVEQRFERYAIQGALIPGADGRMDFTQEGTVAGWIAVAKEDNGPPVGFQVRRMRQSGRVEGISRDRVQQIVGAIQALMAENSAGMPSGPLSPPSRKQIGILIDAVRDTIVRMEAEETVDDMRIEIAGVGNITLGQLRFGMGGEAPGGRLRAWFDMAVEKPTFDGLPKGMERYMPTRVAFKPAISGVSTERVFKLLDDAMADNPDTARLEAEAMAIMTDNATSIGLEAVSLEVDALRLEGSGRMRMLAPKKVGVEARLSAAGLDELIANAQKSPELAQAIPVLLMVRGLGKAEGNRLIWDLAITDEQALVNGVDVMKMAGGGSPDPAPQSPPPKGNAPQKGLEQKPGTKR